MCGVCRRRVLDEVSERASTGCALLRSFSSRSSSDGGGMSMDSSYNPDVGDVRLKQPRRRCHGVSAETVYDSNVIVFRASSCQTRIIATPDTGFVAPSPPILWQHLGNIRL